MQDSDAISDVKNWLISMVVGLGLCPFAEKAHLANTIRYAVCPGEEPDALLTALAFELKRMVGTSRSECETALLIAPDALPNFFDFNDFMGEAEQLVEDLLLSGTIQVVGFHPGFQFAKTPADAPENYTNRSPYPLIHLLREESVSEVSENSGDLMEIPKRNTQVLRELGTLKILERMRVKTSS